MGEPRDPSNLTLSEIDRFNDSASESEAYCSEGDSDIGSGSEGNSENEDNCDQSNVSSQVSLQTQTANTSPIPSTSQNTHRRPQLTWSDTPVMKTFLFTEPTGLRGVIPENNTPMDYFKLIVDDTFLQGVVNETNANAEEVYLSSSFGDNSRISRWKDLTLVEFKTFLGLFFETGVVKMPQLQHYWKKDKLIKTNFGEYMSRDRFLLILRCLHFAKNDPESTDRLQKIRPVIDYFNNKMENIYLPTKELSLDESMVLWRGRLVFRQYIKNKRHKYGIKLYILSEPNGLNIKFCVYAGALDQLSGTGHTEKVVMHLLSERLGKGHSVFVDNFYNSVSLAKKLLEEKTYITGTLRIDRLDNPTEVVRKKLKKGDTTAKYHEGIMVGKWKDSRDVIYISNQYENEMVTITNKRGIEKEKPIPIVRYNENMSGIDRQDQLLSYYPCERKTIRWYRKLFIHIMQIALLNSYLLYKKYNIGNKMTLLAFRQHIIEGLITQLKPDVIAVRVNNHVPKRFPVGNQGRPLRKKCVVCNVDGKRKDTTYHCAACEGQPALCLTNCFENYHK